MARSKKSISYMMAVCFVFLSINNVLALSCETNCLESDFYVHGLCFSPFKNDQGPWDVIPLEQIQERLAIITQKHHTDWIRTYGAINGLENIPAEANTLGLKVAMGTWVRHGSDPNEIDNLIESCQNGVVDIAVIGNEELMAYEDGKDPGALTPTEYFDLLSDIRQQLDDVNCSHIPIAAAEPFEALFELDGTGISNVKHTGLLDKIDVLFLNIYPFWDGVYIDVAVDDLALRYQLALDEITAREPNVTVMIGETGWTSNGLTQVDAEPSTDNLAKYFYKLSKWATDNNVPLFYFEAFDEKWKATLSTDIEANWGIWDSNGHLKHSFIPEPVLCETFDSNANSFCARRDWWVSTAPDPNIQPPDPNSDGQFLRLLYDATGQTWYSSVAFNRKGVGAFPRIVAKFDFRFNGPDTSDDADGFSFMLIPTSLNDKEGCTEYNPNSLVAEQPKLPKTFAIGFDIWDGDGLDDLCDLCDPDLDFTRLIARGVGKSSI